MDYGYIYVRLHESYKKSPCITLTELQQISKIKEVKLDIKTTLISVFKCCLNILRDIDYDYLYQYLKFIKNDIMDLAHYTTGLGCIKKGDIEGLKIVIPSLERQKEIVEYCEYNDTLIKQLEKEIENNKKQAQQFITGIVKTEEHNDTSSVFIDDVQNEIVPKIKKTIVNIIEEDDDIEEENVIIG